MVYTTKFSNVVGDSNWPCLSYDIKQLVCIGLAKSSRMRYYLSFLSKQNKLKDRMSSIWRFSQKILTSFLLQRKAFVGTQALKDHFLPLRSCFIYHLNLPPKTAQYQADVAVVSHVFLIFVIGI